MSETEQVEFYVEVSAADATDDELDRLTRQLLSDLRETNVDSAELTDSGDSPSGTKAAGEVTIGSIIVSALPETLPAVITAVQSWTGRGRGRTVKFKGRGIEFEGSPEDLEKILSILQKRRMKK
jgi:hypothetical protein